MLVAFFGAEAAEAGQNATRRPRTTKNAKNMPAWKQRSAKTQKYIDIYIMQKFAAIAETMKNLEKWPSRSICMLFFAWLLHVLRFSGLCFQVCMFVAF